MMYGEHLQSGAIWGPRPRPERVFTAYPEGGDPEEDAFCIEHNNGLITFPWEVKDEYIFVYKRDEIEAEALRIAHEAGLKDATVGTYFITGVTTSVYYKKNISVTELLEKEKNNIHISYTTYYYDSIFDTELEKIFDNILNQYDDKNIDLNYIALFIITKKHI